MRTTTPTNPWPGVELRHLAAFAAVAREGSFRGAAETLGYVQSAVSQQVAQLEAAVGRRLLERQSGAGGVSVTAAGELLLAHAGEIIGRLGAARADLAELRDEPGRLRIGLVESVSARLMPRIVPALARRSRAVRVEVTEADHCDELLALLRRGEVDAAFARTSALDAGFASASLLSEPIVLLVPADSELAARPEPPAAADVAALDLIDHRMMGELEVPLRRAGVAPRYAIRSDRNGAIHELVAAGVGAAILPALAVDADDPRLAALPLSDLLAPAELRLVWRSGRRSEALRALIEEARLTAGELQPAVSATAPTGSVEVGWATSDAA